MGALASNPADYEAYQYDKNSNRTSVQKCDGQIITYQFDLLNRQTLKILPGTSTADVWTSYDAAGRPVSDLFGSASAPTAYGIVYGSDTAKRLTTETLSMAGVPNRTMTYYFVR